ncbi:MAG: exodeoxyribonuclease V subunit alpha [Pseudomonadales bacterium]|nr:exodeoxyribonuclease V subunit alpha [Pseudomonadales bacterium]
MSSLRSDTRALKHQMSLLIQRIMPATPPATLALVHALIDALDAQHSHILLTPEQVQALDTPAHKALIGSPGDQSPLVQLDNRLYLRRLFNLEKRVAQQLFARNRQVNPASDTAPKHQIVTNSVDALSVSQQAAVAMALNRQLTIISGGPGTGKTTVIRSVVSALKHLDPNLRIAITAPTGKATARLEDSFRQDLRADLGPEIKTIHRLLGYGADNRPRFNQMRRLPTDVLIADEASMIDLSLADALFSALPDTARLILVGDPDQLPSVNLGRLLTDITPRNATDRPPLIPTPHNATARPLMPVLASAQCRLTENFRFTEGASIHELAEALLAGQVTLPDAGDRIKTIAPKALTDTLLRSAFSDYFSALAKCASVQDLLKAFESVRLLAPRYQGPLGVHDLNAKIEQLMQKLGLLKRLRSAHYHGQPILILKNDYQLGLYNGDVGLCLDTQQLNQADQDRDEDARGLIAFFNTGPDAQPRRFAMNALPEHETCFAMTVHKAQGSEFDQVLFVLADALDDAAQRTGSRELIYTGITRAKRQLTLVTTPESWHRASNNALNRRSGLALQLQLLETAL